MAKETVEQNWFSDDGEVIDLEVDMDDFVLAGLLKLQEYLLKHKQFSEYYEQRRTA